ncbi:MAG: aldehyde dehydrogenase EutE [Propionibacteriaceae bacterium]|jgi:propionaldehyde dehydrogenase|nr:aldehyde dehydrogenase EutE [Propionibacteriaceae bacterium]
MSTITAEQIALALSRALSTVSPGQSGAGSTVGAAEVACDGVFATIDEAVAAAKAAQREFIGYSLADRRQIVRAIREFALAPENLDFMASEAVRQTGMGNREHKILKNRAVAELTPGVEDLMTEAWSGDDGLTTLEMSPYGVIGAITPTTNPTETIICNSIGMLAAGNAVVFSPHPRAKELSIWLVAHLNRVLDSVGAPVNLITMVREPSIEATNEMMAHPDVRLLVATGGPGIVDTVLRSGKKAIGAGAGNPPCVVDRTADIPRAARHIVDGASFDNNIPCVAEKEIIAVDAICDLLIFHLEKNGAYLVTDPTIVDQLVALTVNGNHPRTEWVGKSATAILQAIGVTPPAGTRLIILETPLDHPFVQNEMMMPIVPIVRAHDVDEAIDWAIDCEHGNRHTAIMHSSDVNALTRMAKLIQTTIFVKNGPSYAGLGIGGEGFCSFTIAGPTGEGLTSARTFTRKRRCVLVGALNVR